MTKTKKPKKKLAVSNRKFILFLIFVVIAALIASVWWSVYTFGVYNKVQAEAKEQLPTQKIESEAAKQETQQVVAAVSKLMLLPLDEEPLMATVLQAESLQAKNSFYANAVDGDKLLVYPKAGKAILYSPSRKQVINSGDVDLENQTDLDLQ